jgi:hypothetical protein
MNVDDGRRVAVKAAVAQGRRERAGDLVVAVVGNP